jgi:hypothetical protein
MPLPLLHWMRSSSYRLSRADDCSQVTPTYPPWSERMSHMSDGSERKALYRERVKRGEMVIKLIITSHATAGLVKAGLIEESERQDRNVVQWGIGQLLNNAIGPYLPSETATEGNPS